MSAVKQNLHAMSALGLARAVAEVLNNTFFYVGAQTFSTNGNSTVAHGLGAAPTFYAAGIVGDVTDHVDVQAVDATNITLRQKNAAAGADVTTGSPVVWVIASTKL